MDRTRVIFISIIAVALLIAASAFFISNQKEPVTGLVGSEKVPFFSDERVLAEFRENGLEVTVQKAGSREIATDFNLNAYDFAFPAGVPAAEKIQEVSGVNSSYAPFFTPMAIASWEPIAELMVASGLAENQGGYYTVDMDAFLTLVETETRWDELENNSLFNTNRGILITSTDVRTSNSAAMYLALASYVANENQVVPNLSAAQEDIDFLSDLFLRQGLRPDSSATPFEDYLIKGMGHSPIVMIYESQFIAQAALENGSISSDMALMYPEPTIFSTHTLVPLSENGHKIGELLETDPELRQLSIEYGFRNSDRAYFNQFVYQNNIILPDNIVAVIDPPSYEVLEGIIQIIEQKYQQ